MSATNDGGPAFPVQDEVYGNGERQYGSNGMSLRDYFAGMALQGELANPSFDAITPGEYARDAYGLADAMLAARNGKEQA